MNDCVICFEKVNQLNSVQCNAGMKHIVCGDCINPFVKTRRDPEKILKHGSILTCPIGNECTTGSIDHELIIPFLTPAGRSDFDYVILEAQLLKERREANNKTDGSETDAVAFQIQTILDCLLKCPNPSCGAVYDSVTTETTCMAATCNGCNTHFCGFCWLPLEGDGDQVHKHVRNCRLNPEPKQIYCSDKILATQTVRAILIARLLSKHEAISGEILKKVDITSIGLKTNIKNGPFYNHPNKDVAATLYYIRNGNLEPNELHLNPFVVDEESDSDMDESDDDESDGDESDDIDADPDFEVEVEV